MRAGRLFHTVRHLRPCQVRARLWRKLHRPRLDTSPAPTLRQAIERWHGCARRASLIGPDTLRVLNTRRRLADARAWNQPDWPALDRYNLHYFDDLVADGATERVAWHDDLIHRWIADNPPTEGVGWDAYPTSLRIVNWIKWALAGNALDDTARHSLAVQTRWLRARLETHLLGNHLWANAKALLFAGCIFEGTQASRWRQTGLALVRRELHEQILADGGHFERSPMYQAIVLEDLLDLIQLARLFPDRIGFDDLARWRELAARMLYWLKVMSHPDGGIAFFNDAAFGVAPSPAALEAYAARAGIATTAIENAPIHALPESGYVRLAAGPAVLIADVAAIGPDYLPGHAHADTLSFELSLHGRRMLVNGGTSTYARSAERARQRSTAAHNTLTINGRDSSEVWASFRVARRARPHDVAWGQDGATLWLRGAHDGYRRLPGKPLHQREWRLDPQGLQINDWIDGDFEQAVAHLHLHPAWRAQASDARSGSLRPRSSAHAASVHWHCNSAVQIEPDTWQPLFQRARPAQQLRNHLDGPAAIFRLHWAL